MEIKGKKGGTGGSGRRSSIDRSTEPHTHTHINTHTGMCFVVAPPPSEPAGGKEVRIGLPARLARRLRSPEWQVRWWLGWWCFPFCACFC